MFICPVQGTASFTEAASFEQGWAAPGRGDLCVHSDALEADAKQDLEEWDMSFHPASVCVHAKAASATDRVNTLNN